MGLPRLSNPSQGPQRAKSEKARVSGKLVAACQTPGSLYGACPLAHLLDMTLHKNGDPPGKTKKGGEGRGKKVRKEQETNQTSDPLSAQYVIDQVPFVPSSPVEFLISSHSLSFSRLYDTRKVQAMEGKGIECDRNSAPRGGAGYRIRLANMVFFECCM